MLDLDLRSELKITLGLLLFSFTALFFASHNSFMFSYNGWCDPNIYFGGGKVIFNDKILYRDAFDHKGPLIFFIYGIGYLLSNANLHGVYILESISLFVTLLFVYKTAKLFIDRKYAFSVSLLYVLLFISKVELGGAADEFITPFISISFYYFMKFFSEKGADNINRQMFIHGLMFCCAFLIKYSACVFWIPLLLSITFFYFKKKEFVTLFKAVLYFISGFSVVILPVIIYFAINSALYDFYWAYFEFNVLYVRSVERSYLDVLFIVAKRFRGYLIFDTFFFIPILFGVIISYLSKSYIPNIVNRLGLITSFIFTYANQ